MSATEVDSAPSPALPGPNRAKNKLPWFLRILGADNQLAFYSDRALDEDVVVGSRMWRKTFLVNHPDGVKHVLLDNAHNYAKSPPARRLLEPLGMGLLVSEGSYWRRHRQIMSPAFDQRSLTGYADAIVETAASVVAGLDRVPAGHELDISKEMTLATLAITSKALFSTDSDLIIHAIASGFQRYQSKSRIDPFDILGLPEKIPRRRTNARAAADAFAQADSLIYGLLASRAEQNDPGPQDLLGRLMQARDDQTGETLTHKEIRDEVMTIFLAGHETTALVLTWTWYLLSQHPAQEALLQSELVTVLEGRPPMFDDIPKLRYTRMIVEESMRLYPPVYTLSRIAVGDDEFLGHQVPRGSRVAIVPWLLHRHRKLWEKPDTFDPYRFLPEQSAKRSRYSYLPFSTGPRVCIGARLAMTEIMIILASIAQRYRLRLAADQLVEPQGLLTLRPRHGMRMRLERR